MKLFAILLLATFSITAKSQQKTGNQLTKNKIAFVYSFNGLYVRESGNTNANVVKILNFGDTVEILEATDIKCTPISIFVKDTVTNPNVYEENPVMENLELGGEWVKIKYKTYVGFTNSIYLSSLPHFKNLEKKVTDEVHKNNEQDYAGLEDVYFLSLNKHYNIPKNALELTRKALFYKKKINKKDDVIEISFNKKYKDGLLYTYKDAYFDSGAGGYSITISKKGMSFNEAIIFCRAFFYFQNVEYKRKLGFYKDEDGKYIITSYSEGGGCTGEIYKNKAGDWEISYGCGGC